MLNGQDPDNPFEDLQEILQSFKDKYGQSIDARPGAGPRRAEPQSAGTEPGREEEADDWSLNFDYNPRQIRSHLDRYVIGQDEAKKRLANAVCYHYRERKGSEEYYQKKNILMIGNTGVGKTHLVEVLADFIGVPFVKADATKFSGTGYVGKNVSSLVRELTQRADDNLNKAEHGIVFLDEIDKITSDRSDGGRDVSGQDVQSNLLKLLEETEVKLVDPSNPMSMMQGMQQMFGGGGMDRETLNTRNILFIVSGAFPGLEEIVGRRLEHGGVGFTVDVDSERNVKLLRNVAGDDLINYGLEAEFVGRLPVRTCLHDLDEDHLYRILTESRSSILRQYRQDFESYDITLSVTEEGLRAIARRAASMDLGARALTTVLENTLFEFMHELPDRGCRELEITRETVENPRRELYRLLMDLDFDQRLEEEFGKYGVELDLTDQAREEIIRRAAEADRLPFPFFKDRFASLHHVLNIIDLDRLELTPDLIDDPETELDELCSQHYRE